MSRPLNRPYGSVQNLSLEPTVVQDNVPSEVAPNLFIGSIHAAFNKEFLFQRGITHIVNASGLEPTFPGIFTYLTVSVRDKEYADILSVVPLVHSFVATALRRGAGVLVHCTGGRSRSASLCAAHLMLARDMTFDDAAATVLHARPVVAINRGFQQQLRAFDAAKKNLVVASQVLLRVRLAEVSKRKTDEEVRAMKHKRRLSSRGRCTTGEPHAKSRTFGSSIEEVASPRARPSPASCSRKGDGQSEDEDEDLDLPQPRRDHRSSRRGGAKAKSDAKDSERHPKGGFHEIRGKMMSKLRFCHASTERTVAIPLLRSLEKTLCCRRCKQRLVYYRSIVRLDMTLPDVSRSDLDPPTPRDQPAEVRSGSHAKSFSHSDSGPDYSPHPTPKAEDRPPPRRRGDPAFQLSDNSKRGKARTPTNAASSWESPAQSSQALALQSRLGLPMEVRTFETDADDDEERDEDESDRAVPVVGELRLDSTPPLPHQSPESPKQFPRLDQAAPEVPGGMVVANVHAGRKPSGGPRRVLPALMPVVAAAPHLRVEPVPSPTSYMELASVSDPEDPPPMRPLRPAAAASVTSLASLSLDDQRARAALEQTEDTRTPTPHGSEAPWSKPRREVPRLCTPTLAEAGFGPVPSPRDVLGSARLRRRSRSLSLSTVSEKEHWVALAALLEEVVSPKRLSLDITLAIRQDTLAETATPRSARLLEDATTVSSELDVASARSHASHQSVSSLASELSDNSEAGGSSTRDGAGAETARPGSATRRASEDFRHQSRLSHDLCELDAQELEALEASFGFGPETPHQGPGATGESRSIFVEWLPWMREIKGRSECRGNEMPLACFKCAAPVGSYGWDWESLPASIRAQGTASRRRDNPETNLPLPYFRLDTKAVQRTPDMGDMGGALEVVEPSLATPGRALPPRFPGHVEAATDDRIVRTDDAYAKSLTFALGTSSSPELLRHAGRFTHASWAKPKMHFDFDLDQTTEEVERLPQL